jgi:hypothetical protein
VKRVLLGLGLIVSVVLLLLSLAAVPVVAMSMGGLSDIGIALLTSLVGIVATTAFVRALRRAELPLGRCTALSASDNRCHPRLRAG